MASKDVSAPQLKMALLSLLIVGSGIFAWISYSRTQRGLATPEQRSELPRMAERLRQAAPGGASAQWAGGERPAGLDPEARQAEMAERLGLTGEQRQRMEQLRNEMASNPNAGPGAMRDAMQQVLTPEQREQFGAGGGRGEEFRAQMEARRAEREQEARQALSPAEYREWQRIREERMVERRERFGGRGPGGGPGGGPRS